MRLSVICTGRSTCAVSWVKGSTFVFVLRMPLSGENEWLRAQHDDYHVSVWQRDEEMISYAQSVSDVSGQLIMPAAKELTPTTSAALTSPTSINHLSSVSYQSPSFTTSPAMFSDFFDPLATSPLFRLRSLANKPPALDTINPLSVYRPTPSSSSCSPIPSLRTVTALTPSTPLTPSSSSSSTSSNSSGSTTPVARSILVADDNEVNRKILSRILTSLRYRPVMANDGVQAVEAVKTNITADGPPFLCVFMDICMPHLDGYEATRHIRALGCQTPIIALTANALSEERKKALEAGMNAFQTKPIRKVELQKLLHSIVTEHNNFTGAGWAHQGSDRRQSAGHAEVVTIDAESQAARE